MSDEMMNRCCTCHLKCDDIGDKNTDGITKEHCCHCWSKKRWKYSRPKWCTTCLGRLEKQCRRIIS